jgi:hypothetical protein
VSDCCTPKGYRTIFSEKSAQAEARRYRRRGLDPLSRRIADLVKERGVEGMTMLEVGGGIGAVEIELLKAGVTRAVNVELTPTYEEVARVERPVMDFVETGADVEAADFVVLNRVICCYPDMPRLTAAAAERVRHAGLDLSELSLVDAPGADDCQLRVSGREVGVSDLPTSPGADPGGGGEAWLKDHPHPPGPAVAGGRLGQANPAERDGAGGATIWRIQPPSLRGR